MGLAGAGVTVMAMSALTVLFSDAERPKAVGIYEAANFLGLPAGPVLGGWMLSRLWWGWVFLLNVPIVAFGLITVLALVPESRAARRPALDPHGMIASAAAGHRDLRADPGGPGRLGRSGCPGADGRRPRRARRVRGTGTPARQAGRQSADRPGTCSVPRRSPGGQSWAGWPGLAMIGAAVHHAAVLPGRPGSAAPSGPGCGCFPWSAALSPAPCPPSALARAAGARLTVTLGFVLVVGGLVVGAATGTASGTAFVAVWMAVLCAGAGLALTAATSAALSQLPRDRSGIGSAVVQAFQKTAGTARHRHHGQRARRVYQARLGLHRVPGQPLPRRSARAFTAAWPSPAAWLGRAQPLGPALPSLTAWTSRCSSRPGSPSPASP